MFAEVGAVCEALATHLAQKWPLAGVRAGVPPQVRCLGVALGLGAQLASESWLPLRCGVLQLMLTQVEGLREGFLASSALVRLRACVPFDMPLQVGACAERLRTQLTLKRPLARVLALVVAQLRWLVVGGRAQGAAVFLLL